MHVAVLAASGATGRQLAVQALDRGHIVTAIARDLARLDLPTSAQLHRVAADVQDPSSLARALTSIEVVVSGLGSTAGSTGAVLTAGARAVVDAATPRIVWLGAYGTGASARTAGIRAGSGPTRRLITSAPHRPTTRCGVRGEPA